MVLADTFVSSNTVKRPSSQWINTLVSGDTFVQWSIRQQR